MCGAVGSPVAMQDLRCTGGEFSIDECTWSAPDAACMGHALDSIVYCGRSGGAMQDGAARLLDSDGGGAPSLGSEGLLEVYLKGVWSPVCGVTPGAASVACKAMGFAGAASVAGISKANSVMPMVGSLSCGGSEASLAECSFDVGDDVYCAPAEAAIVRCSG